MTRLGRAILVACFAAASAIAFPSAQQPAAPLPESALGFAPCADYKLATYEQIAEYFHRLDAASDRMVLQEIGKTVEGRPQLMAVISSEQNLRDSAKYKEIARRLALARDLSDEQARALSREGKAIVWIDFGLHASEVAPPQAAPLVAYRAVTDESEEMREIRDQVIFLLVPNMNPDGGTYVSDWYMSHVGTPYQDSTPPELWHRYVGHDNNRDWFMFNMPESRNVARQIYFEWFPQIVYNQHQAAPYPARIFVPPFDDPMNPKIPPLVMRGVNLVGDAMTRRLDEEGKRGAISRIGFDTWWNGGMRTAPYFHNMIGVLTETGHATATPAQNDPRSFPKIFPNGMPTLEPTTYYPSPYLGGEWHLRDSCDLIVSTSMATLDVGAELREEWLYDIYQMGRDAIRQGGKEAYLVTMDQWDPGTAVKMINVLRLGAVDVDRLTSPFRAADRSYPPGTFVMREAQPFSPYLQDLMEPQVYPDLRLYPGGPPKRPYDITGWTLPYQMGVKVDRVADISGAALERVDIAPRPSFPSIVAPRFAYALDTRVNDTFRAINRLLTAGDTVYRSPVAVTTSEGQWPAGTFLIPTTKAAATRVQELARELGLKVSGVDTPPAAQLVRLRAPRIAVYHAYGGNMDEGWTRWLLEQFDFAFSNIHDRDLRAGNLRAKFDVVLLPDASYGEMVTGLERGTIPDEFAGGMTAQGVSNLGAFVNDGGTLVALDSASELPLATFGLPVRDVTANQREANFFVPGALLRVQIDNTNPVGYGMPQEASAFFAESPAFAFIRPGDQDGSDPAPTDGLKIVARYPQRNLLMSGWLLGERVLAGRAAVLEGAVGKGRVVLIGFRTQHRAQTHGTFKLLFNALYLGGSERPVGAAPSASKTRQDGGLR